MQNNSTKQSEVLLLDYIFGLLDKNKNNEVEDMLDRDQELAETVDGMMNFCMYHKIRNKEAFYEQKDIELKELKKRLEPHLQKNTIDKSNTSIFLYKKQRQLWRTALILIIIITGFIYWQKVYKQKIKQGESIELLEQIRSRHGDRLVTAGPESNWILEFKNGNYKKSRSLLKSPATIQNTTEQFIAAGLLLYTQPPDASQALGLLQKNTAEVDYPQHAAVAYYLLEDYTSLAEIAKKYPQIWRNMPAKLSERIQKEPNLLEQYRQ